MKRTGHTLIEVVAALVVMAAVAVLATNSFRMSLLGVTGSKVDARRLSLDLIRMRRRAISTGVNHGVAFNRSGRRATSYYPFQRRAGSVFAIDESHVFEVHQQVVSSSGVIEFLPTGESVSSHTIRFTASGRRWDVQVIKATGAVRVVAR